jgi:flavin-binding protein dodecin
MMLPLILDISFQAKYFLSVDYMPLTVNVKRREEMTESTYKIVELVGTSDTSWEDAARTAVETAGKSLRDLRIAEITKLDMTLQDGKVALYRARVNVSFKYVSGED